ncbi:hypothetical protein ACTXT7_011940 [Hymenolepis weldensis]
MGKIWCLPALLSDECKKVKVFLLSNGVSIAHETYNHGEANKSGSSSAVGFEAKLQPNFTPLSQAKKLDADFYFTPYLDILFCPYLTHETSWCYRFA